ncbi:CybS-domain-containing protein [Myxozyma melibiosi]|uniref:Succinate dehydrogenase [ubiquinone] cytochrome b small subunit n=1 Tax=Myxozyma melibiosi TaxID=54550 RepID=A0ABR1F7W1_9ASCO
MSALRAFASPLRAAISRPCLSAARPAFSAPAVRHLGIPPLIPQPPGGIVGTVNDAAKVPPPDKFHGSYHWTFERIIAIGLIPLTVAPFVSTTAFSPAIDSILVSSLLVHSYYGFQSCIIDYIPLREFGKVHHVCMYLLLAGTVVTGYGFYKLETEDVGLAGTIAKVWTA